MEAHETDKIGEGEGGGGLGHGLGGKFVLFLWVCVSLLVSRSTCRASSSLFSFFFVSLYVEHNFSVQFTVSHFRRSLTLKPPTQAQAGAVRRPTGGRSSVWLKGVWG